MKDPWNWAGLFSFEGTEQLPMGRFGHAGFQEVDGCEHMFIITAAPGAPSPIAGIQTLGQLMLNQPATFNTVDTEATDTAVILYTSGATGQPKGAELSHANMIFNARLADNRLFNLSDHDVYLIILPLFHSFGQTVQMNMAFYKGGTITLMARFDPGQALAIMERDNVTFFAGVPTMYWSILSEIEETLMTHPAISLAAVIGVPHDRHGEEVKAFVILREGATETEADLVAWSKATMANYKYPRLFKLCDSLPMTATGKILKRKLREL